MTKEVTKLTLKLSKCKNMIFSLRDFKNKFPISCFKIRLCVFRGWIEFWLNANVIPAHIMFTKF